MPVYLSITQAAQRLGLRPRDISDALYQNRLTEAHYDTQAGRRVFRADRLDAVAAILKRRRVVR